MIEMPNWDVNSRNLDPYKQLEMPLWAYVYSEKYYRQMVEEGRKLEIEGLYLQALEHLKKAAAIKPNRALAYVEMSVCYLKLGNELAAYTASQMANNRSPNRKERFMILMADYALEYGKFSGEMTVRNSKRCHAIIDLQLDISHRHPVPLANRVMLHLDLVCEKKTFEITKCKELEQAEAAMRHYLGVTTHLPRVLAKFVQDFVGHLEGYLLKLPDCSQPKWRGLLAELYCRARVIHSGIPQNRHNTNYPKFGIMKKLLFLLLFLSSFSLAETAACGTAISQASDGIIICDTMEGI